MTAARPPLDSARPGPEPAPSTALRVPLLDLRQQHAPLADDILTALRGLLDRASFVLGENVQAFEQEMASYCGTRYAIGVASGTDALLLALKAVGVGPGDEVIVPSYTFTAPAAAVCRLGARPMFVDCEPDGFNLDVEQAIDRITTHTRAVVPVHLYGEAADLGPLLEAADRHGVAVIEDCAQAAGARYRGRPVGGFGRAGGFSFYPSKNLGACGDGGLVTTNSPTLADAVRLWRNQADSGVLGGVKYHHETVGFNSRLDEFQAAILRLKLPHLDAWNEARIAHVARYADRLASAPVRLPRAAADRSHIYHLYTIRSNRRDALRDHLRAKGIGCEVYYPRPLHLQGAYRQFGYQPGSLPRAEACSREALSLPMYPELTNEQIEVVVEAVLSFPASDQEVA